MVVVDKQQLYRQIPSVHEMLQWPVFADCTRDFAVQHCNTTKKLKIVLEREPVLFWMRRFLLLWNEEPEGTQTAQGDQWSGGGDPYQPWTRPIPEAVFEAMKETLSGYTNLEMSLQTGKRGGRVRGVTDRLCALVGAGSCQQQCGRYFIGHQCHFQRRCAGLSWGTC